MSTVLTATNVTKQFGGLVAVDAVSVEVESGRITGLIGPNGAGKSTFFNCLTGMTTPDAGSVQFDGRELIQTPPAGIHALLNWICFSQIAWACVWPLVVLLVFVPAITADLADVEFLLACYVAAGVRILGALQLRAKRQWTWAMHGALAGADAALAMVAVFRVSAVSLGAPLAPYPDTAAFSMAPDYGLPFQPLLWTAVGLAAANAVWLFSVVPRAGIRAALSIHAGAHKINSFGLARTFQNIRLFDQLTVLDNVRIGAHLRGSCGIIRSLLRTPGFKREERRLTTEAEAALTRVGLSDSLLLPAGSLSYGQQRRLEIARALAGQPKALLLDEPAAGMNHSETAELAALLTGLRNEGLAILIIEHDMRLMMELCDTMVVLNHGGMIAKGTPDEIRANPAVIHAYLGSGAHGHENEVPA